MILNKRLLRKPASLTLILILTLSLTACKSEPPLTRYDAQFLQLFDTVTSLTGYAKSKEEFTAFAKNFRDELSIYHQLYDIYNDYEGINNIKTINDQAGITPVVVDEKIIELLEFSKEMEAVADDYVNVAMGSVLRIWHDYRTQGITSPEEAEIPPMDELEAAAEHTDLGQIIIDREASTVYLADPQMRLDVGAIAKGYAVEQICRKMEADGVSHVLVSVGGNVRAIGAKEDGTRWKVGIQNPDIENTESSTKYIHNVELEDMSLVTSGTYQRYYTVDGVRYHHIVNPDYLMPWNEYDSVSILCRDSGLADALSTAVFNMPLEQGKALVEQMDGVEALWIYPDGSEVYSDGFRDYINKN